jgi:hypothetical protein
MAVVYAVNLITMQSNSSIENYFSVIDTANIERIFMVDKENQQIDLQRKNGRWVMNGDETPIQDNVQILLKTLLKIEVKRPVAKAAYDNELKRMAAKSVKVEVYQRVYRIDLFGLRLFPHIKRTKVFYVGGATQDFQGTFMKPEDEDDIYITYIPGFKGYLSERFTARRADWLSHKIYNYNIMDMSKVRVEFPRNIQESYEIINRGNRTFKLIKLPQNVEVNAFDTVRVLEELAAFSNINYELLLDSWTDERIDSLKKILPVRIVTVTDKLAKKHRLTMYYRPNVEQRMDIDGKLFDHDMDRMYAFIDDAHYPVSVQYFVIDNISRPLSYLINNAKDSLQRAQTLP